jgi:hypothetical protein
MGIVDLLIWGLGDLIKEIKRGNQNFTFNSGIKRKPGIFPQNF